MKEIKFKGKRVDDGEWVYGHYFKTPLTDENSGVASKDGWFFLSDGKERHCISNEHGVVDVVDPETVECVEFEAIKNKVDELIIKHEKIANKHTGYKQGEYFDFCSCLIQIKQMLEEQK